MLLPRKDLKRLLSSDDTCDLTLDDDDDDDNALWRRDDDDDGYDVMQDFDFKVGMIRAHIHFIGAWCVGMIRGGWCGESWEDVVMEVGVVG